MKELLIFFGLIAVAVWGWDTATDGKSRHANISAMILFIAGVIALLHNGFRGGLLGGILLCVAYFVGSTGERRKAEREEAEGKRREKEYFVKNHDRWPDF